MLKSFEQNIENKQLIGKQQKVLLGISGGIDSMVLLHLFERSGYDFGIAHCNFHLRGEESDGDEQFVRDTISQFGFKAFFADFETEEYARINGISIEMAARKLRYDYFEEIRKQEGYDLIATAHHQDDLIETFFLNLSRKTGIHGLTGIKEKSGKLIRPLLFAGRDEIEKYAAKNYIDYREDSSNSDVVYQRNFVRHKILPIFNELNPSFRKNLLAGIENLKDAEQVYMYCISEQENEVLQRNNGELTINIQKLRNIQFPKVFLLEVLSEFGFNSSVVNDVFESLNSESGKQFYSRSHRLVKDREQLFVSIIKNDEDRFYYIEEGDLELFQPIDLNIEEFDAENFQIIKNQNVACIDRDQVHFPLLIRKWKQGDYFQPLGMNGFKKVSDFFIDQKLPLHEKENTWLLCSGKKIVWIMGQRLDERFKITSKTKKVLKIEILG